MNHEDTNYYEISTSMRFPSCDFVFFVVKAVQPAMHQNRDSAI